MDAPISTFRFRHADGFSQEMFACFQAQCELWSARLRAFAQGWEHLFLGRISDAPRYEFHGPDLSQDGTIVSFGVGGDRSYGAAKMFEDELPKDLWQYFPLAFQERLEYECGGQWHSISAHKESELRDLLGLAKSLADKTKMAESTSGTNKRF